jgi:hypothetical protein
MQQGRVCQTKQSPKATPPGAQAPACAAPVARRTSISIEKRRPPSPATPSGVARLTPGAVGIYSGAVGIYSGAVGIHSGGVGIHSGAVGIYSGGVGIYSGGVGIDSGAVGIYSGAVGIHSGGVGIYSGGVGIYSGAVGIYSGSSCRICNSAAESMSICNAKKKQQLFLWLYNVLCG